MKLLLDTHILIWLHTAPEKLSKKAISYLRDEGNVCYYSAVSVWECSIKHSAHPDAFSLSGADLKNLSMRANLLCVPLLSEHAVQVETLHCQSDHKDPFDRVLLAQAKEEGMFFLTHDKRLLDYNEDCVIYV